MKNFYLLFSFSLLLLSQSIKAQGCSDAGVCSVGSLGLVQEHVYEKLPHDNVTLQPLEVEDTEVFTEGFDPSKSQKDNSLPIDANINYELDSVKQSGRSNSYQPPKFLVNYFAIYGTGDNNTSLLTNQLELNYSLSEKLYAQVKVPFQTIIGELATINGVGDVTLSFSYTAKSSRQTKLSMVGGVKIPTGTSNLSEGGNPLPMVYQPSLGTTDGLFGLNYRYKKWDATVGYQHPFNANNNGYIHDTINSSVYNSYFESRALQRASDAVFRLNRSYRIKKSVLSTGMLFIYHLKNDTYKNNLGERVEAKGSQGLTINLNVAATISVNDKIDFIAIYASPLLLRESRPDGLTRQFVAMAGFRFKLF